MIAIIDPTDGLVVGVADSVTEVNGVFSIGTHQFYGCVKVDCDSSILPKRFAYKNGSFTALPKLDTKEDILAYRDFLIATKIDGMSQDRLNSMNAAEKLAWQEYREALLNIESLPYFPDHFTWPTAPIEKPV